MSNYKFITQEIAGIVYEYDIPVVMDDNLACKQARARKIGNEVLDRLNCLGCSERLLAVYSRSSTLAEDYKQYCIAYAQQYPIR